MLKLLFVLALIALLIWFLYRRLRPYIQLLRQFLHVFRGTIDLNSNPSTGEFRQGDTSSASKLVRCEHCNTWIPMGRALHANSSAFCSPACLKQAPTVKQRKTAS